MQGIVVSGAAGRMGSTVIRLAHESGALKVVGALEYAASPQLNKDAGELAGVGKIGVPITAEIAPLLKDRVVVIEFSTPAATLEHVRSAAEKKIPVVIGTTGSDQKQLEEIKRLARRTPIMLSANMSLGVNLLVNLLGKVAEKLGDDYDVEIIEAHHRFKIDAPSGTALAMGRAVATGLKRDLDKVGINGRKGIVGARTKKEIAMLSVRAGDIVGDHMVIFGGIGERLEFTHRAHSRENFARGALRAAEWLAHKKPGLYGMPDVLGLD
ncbi:MAG: 4-hydroxy-tetrahydrodipicolinate reductase [Deltaproteobacteria bacterium]|nr:4-hydroxy-tetrahydrodipicolinate reductase [Deltaproteobacteria bacterium]